MKLLMHLVRKDFKKNRIISIALLIFMILSAVFMLGGLRIVGIMISSINGLNKIAVPPEYVQMHKGEYEEEAFKDFVESQEYIEDTLVIKMYKC